MADHLTFVGEGLLENFLKINSFKPEEQNYTHL